MNSYADSSLREIRRDLHAYPETGWREYRTTAIVAKTFEELGFSVYLGSDAVDVNERMGVPDSSELTKAKSRAKSEGAPSDYLDKVESSTGLVVEREFGPGPVVGIRVDVDALPITEADDPAHKPARKQFRSRNSGAMHACGHDGHVAIGIGVAREISIYSRFNGTLKLFFQPAEEGLRGGLAMSRTNHLDGLDYLLSLHLGLGYPTGTIVAGLDRPYSSKKVDVEFTGESAHAGLEPQKGNNALQAMSTAITNLYGISRHSGGVTRINVGHVRSPNAQNAIAESSRLRYEIRSDEDSVNTYLSERASQIIESAAQMYDVSVSESLYGTAPTFEADTSMIEIVSGVSHMTEGVGEVIKRDRLQASEDVSHLVRRVQEEGGDATYIGVGASNSAGHHNPLFDFDENALDIAVAVISETVNRLPI